jgi:hypothetical protein
MFESSIWPFQLINLELLVELLDRVFGSLVLNLAANKEESKEEAHSSGGCDEVSRSAWLINWASPKIMNSWHCQRRRGRKDRFRHLKLKNSEQLEVAHVHAAKSSEMIPVPFLQHLGVQFCDVPPMCSLQILSTQKFLMKFHLIFCALSSVGCDNFSRLLCINLPPSVGLGRIYLQNFVLKPPVQTCSMPFYLVTVMQPLLACIFISFLYLVTLELGVCYVGIFVELIMKLNRLPLKKIKLKKAHIL